MNKKRAKFNFVLTSILLALALVLCFVQFKLPASNNNFNGLFNSISATEDITSGFSATYEITSENATDEEIENTITLMRNILPNQNLDGVNVYRQGNFIKAEVQSASNASQILSIVGTPKSFFISELDQEKITEEELEEYDIVGTQIKNAYATTQANMNKTINGITIEFTQSGISDYQKLTKKVAAKSAESDRKVTFYIGGEKQTSLTGITESKENTLSFYYEDDGTENAVTYEDAQAFALQILMSSTGVNIEIIANNSCTATLGSKTLILTLIGFASLLLAVMILLPIFFGDLGFVANLSILIGVALNIFILQALPFTTMSIAGIIGSMVGMALLVICHVIYLNKMKSEFATLKKLQLSARTGFKKSWLLILDTTAIAFLGAVALGLWNISFVSTFGIGLAVGAFVALFNSVVLFKDFITWYVCINNKNYKRVKFTKEEGNE